MKKEKNSKNRELTIYMRVKDHLTHDDIDSTLTASLLLAKDSSFVDSAKIAKTNYQGQRFTYAQAVLKDAGKYLMEIKANGYADRYVSVDIPKLYKNEQFRELKPVYLRMPSPEILISCILRFITSTITQSGEEGLRLNTRLERPFRQSQTLFRQSIVQIRLI